jgi:hypothetical protein
MANEVDFIHIRSPCQTTTPIKDKVHSWGPSTPLGPTSRLGSKFAPGDQDGILGGHLHARGQRFAPKVSVLRNVLFYSIDPGRSARVHAKFLRFFRRCCRRTRVARWFVF